MSRVMDEKDFYLSSHPEWIETLGSGQPAWLAALRSRALESFASAGFPHTRLEAWRYTNVTPIARTPFRPVVGNGAAETAVPAGLAPLLLDGVDQAARMVFLNGAEVAGAGHRQGLSEGVTLAPLAEELESTCDQIQRPLEALALDENPFAALNAAFLRDGVVLVVPDGTVVERPVHVVFASEPGRDPLRTHPRILILAGRNSQVTVVESYGAAREGVYLVNPVTSIVAGENATVDHLRLQRDADQAFHVAATEIRQARSSTVRSMHVTLGAALCRHDVLVSLDEEGAHGTLDGLYVVHGDQHVDHQTTLDHRVPHTGSSETFRGVLSGRGRGVFNGRVVVRPDAQKTRAEQSNRNLLLSDDVEIHTKPQLEIHADDVKCSHGATIGRLDEDALFYLRSRGLAATEARWLLTYAFAAELLETIRSEPLRRHLGEVVKQRLALDAEGGGSP